MEARPGDKIKIKLGLHAGSRGVVTKAQRSRLFVRLDSSGEVVEVTVAEATNFSLAARKAWVRMPDRRVGRPKGTTRTDRVSVTLRMDRDLWEQFEQAEASGLIVNRTATINAWIANGLNELRSKE
jgi:uncharacterized protein (DUF4415 family)